MSITNRTNGRLADLPAAHAFLLGFQAGAKSEPSEVARLFRNYADLKLIGGITANALIWAYATHRAEDAADVHPDYAPKDAAALALLDGRDETSLSSDELESYNAITEEAREIWNRIYEGTLSDLLGKMDAQKLKEQSDACEDTFSALIGIGWEAWEQIEASAPSECRIFTA